MYTVQTSNYPWLIKKNYDVGRMLITYNSYIINPILNLLTLTNHFKDHASSADKDAFIKVISSLSTTSSVYYILSFMYVIISINRSFFPKKKVKKTLRNW